MLDVGDPVARRQETFMRAWASRQNKAPNSKPSAEESLGKGNLGGTSKILLLHELSAQVWHAKGFLNPSLYYYSSYHWGRVGSMQNTTVCSPTTIVLLFAM